MDAGIAANIAGFHKRAAKYDTLHPEIFNDREQQRLRRALETAASAIRSGDSHALDFGCGSGNLTRHLIALGLTVTAADVTPAFLRIVESRYRISTIELRNGDLRHLPDSSFDLIAAYSVLHHIPDYVSAVRGLIDKLKPGGVLSIEHERNSNYYFPTQELAAFRQANYEATRAGLWDPAHKRWQRLLRAAVVPSRHVARYQQRRRFSPEGDIHVHPDDHIDWELVITAIQEAGASVVQRTNYLTFADGYDERTWERWAPAANDMTSLIVRTP